MGHEEKILHAKHVAKYLAENGATITESEQILDLCSKAIKESLIDIEQVREFRGWMT